MTVFGDKSVQSSINALGKGLGYGFLGYQVQGGTEFSGRGIIKNNGGYKSTYENAQWPSNGDRQTCALIFLGAAYVTYYFITFVYSRCQFGSWKGFRLDGSDGAHGPKDFMVAMGFTSTQLNGEKYGTQIAELLEDGHYSFDELKIFNSYSYNLTYSKFLQDLEEKADSGSAVDFPLTGCYRLAQEYFSLKSENKVTQAMEKMMIEFEKLRGYWTHDFTELKQNIQTFLTNVNLHTIHHRYILASTASVRRLQHILRPLLLRRPRSRDPHHPWSRRWRYGSLPT